MRIPLGWLAEWVELPESPRRLASLLTMAGLEVEAVEAIAWESLAGQAGRDYVLAAKVTSNRGDCLSLRGVAREVAAVLDRSLRGPKWSAAPEAGEPIDAFASVMIEATDLCPRYSAKLVRGVTLRPSPEWMQQRLVAAGLRPINNVVDATNYVLLELGQPLHAFDFATLAEGTIVVRRARAGEVMATLDGQPRTLTEDDLVIADPSRAVALAGVMGGLNTEVTERTKDVLIESAHFWPPGVRRTSKRLGLSSESSYRFERWVDPGGTVEAMERAAALICETAGAVAAPGIIDVWPGRCEPRRIPLRPRRVNALLGARLTSERQAGLLRRLGLVVQPVEDPDSVGKEGALLVEVPTHRADLRREEDLVEEIARVYGYNRIRATLPRVSGTVGGYAAEVAYLDRVRSALAGAGLTEVQSFSLTDPALAELGLSGQANVSTVTTNNPVTTDYSAMRTSLLPSMLAVAAHNHQRDQRDLYLFEVGRTYHRPPEGFEERNKAGVLLCGINWEGAWNLTDAAVAADFTQGKGIVSALLDEFGMEGGQFAPHPHPLLEAERAASLRCENVEVAWLGQVAAKVAERWDLLGGLFYAEVDLDALRDFAGPTPQFSALPAFPAALRDLAIVAPHERGYAELESIIVREGGSLLEAVTVFDVYSGPPVPAGCVSVAVRLTFRSPERTLTEGQIEPLVRRIVSSLEALPGVTIRRR